MAVCYLVRCPVHGERDVDRPISQFREPFVCPEPGCELEATQVITAPIGFRIEDMENAGSERGGDLGHVNLGLPGENVSVGKDSTGKEHFEYRPRRSSEVNAYRAREICKENNLTPIEGARYRTAGQR